jgi:hypothetical protein
MTANARACCHARLCKQPLSTTTRWQNENEKQRGGLVFAALALVSMAYLNIWANPTTTTQKILIGLFMLAVVCGSVFILKAALKK